MSDEKRHWSEWDKLPQPDGKAIMDPDGFRHGRPTIVTYEEFLAARSACTLGPRERQPREGGDALRQHEAAIVALGLSMLDYQPGNSLDWMKLGKQIADVIRGVPAVRLAIADHERVKEAFGKVATWYDSTHGDVMGHDHHCPVGVGVEDTDGQCTCGWTEAFAVLEDAWGIINLEDER